MIIYIKYIDTCCQSKDIGLIEEGRLGLSCSFRPFGINMFRVCPYIGYGHAINNRSTQVYLQQLDALFVPDLVTMTWACLANHVEPEY